jgi:hypothetical protein
LTVSLSIPLEYQAIIEDFLLIYWSRRATEIGGLTSSAVKLPPADLDELFQSRLAEDLILIARAAAGELGRDKIAQLADCIWSLFRRLFFLNRLNEEQVLRSIPEPFWASNLGKMVARALLWLRADDLITIREAAQLGNLKIPTIRQCLDMGKLTPYYNPDAASLYHQSTFVSRIEVQQLMVNQQEKQTNGKKKSRYKNT